MPNLLDHVLETGGDTLARRPFDALDALVLTQLVYMPYEGFLDAGETRDVEECAAFLRERVDLDSLDRFQQKRYRLTEVCAALPRYRRWRVHDYVDRVDRAAQTQFCAAAYDLDDGQTTFLSFRGTDVSVAGWLEDLNLSYMVVPAQETAARYVDRLAASSRLMELGGHSKGGNLAVYAAGFCSPEARERLRAVYSFDGPGMYRQSLYSDGYLRIQDRIRSFIPQSSVVGRLMLYHPVYTVVESSAAGILQHDAMTWQVENGRFVRRSGLDTAGRVAEETLRAWMAGLDAQARQSFVQVLDQTLQAARVETVGDLTEDWRARTLKGLEALRNVDPALRRSARLTVHSLFAAGASEVAKLMLPAAAQSGARLLERLGSRGEDEDAIQLVRPTVLRLAEIRAYRRECLEAQSSMDGCSALEDYEDPLRWVERVRRLNRAETCPEGLVPSECYLALRLRDQRVVGMLDLRLSLDHPVLRSWGGHVGFSVRPCERGRGYAKEMLRQALARARQLGMERLLVTCDENNVASERTILANGGVLEGTVPCGKGLVKRYWIALE